MWLMIGFVAGFLCGSLLIADVFITASETKDESNGNEPKN